VADIGVATSADAFSQQWNPAKYAFATDKQGFSISYTPYLTDLANDISLGQLTYYNKISDEVLLQVVSVILASEKSNYVKLEIQLRFLEQFRPMSLQWMALIP
jgi:hypothetical protein